MIKAYHQQVRIATCEKRRLTTKSEKKQQISIILRFFAILPFLIEKPEHNPRFVVAIKQQIEGYFLIL